MTFTDRLRSVQRTKQSLLCVGLDIDPAKLPSSIRPTQAGMLSFLRAIIESTGDLVCAYKPNLAFFEALGADGWVLLQKTLSLLPQDVISIGDAKRGDIGNTAQKYAKSLLDNLGFDAVTVNPYMGRDSVEPFLERKGKGTFVLSLTSNPGSADFQHRRLGRAPLYEAVIRTALTWDDEGSIGFVVGATHSSQIKKVRACAPRSPLLIPGVGSQGGDLEAAVRYGCTRDGDLAIINAGRSILYASPGKDFALAARREAERLRDNIESVRQKVKREK